jgi:hypothetical protein
MYESPIGLIQEEMEIYAEGEILRAVQKVGVNVDKEELLRALAYDREQYVKGYKDGVNAVCERIEKILINKLREYVYSQDPYEQGKFSAYGDALEIVKEEMS